MNNRNLEMDKALEAMEAEYLPSGIIETPEWQPVRRASQRILDERTLRYCAALLERRADGFTRGRKSAADALRSIAAELLLIVDPEGGDK